MKWLSRAIAAIVDAFADVVDAILTAVVEFASDLIEMIGHGLGAFFRWLADYAEEGDHGNNAAALRWIGNVIESAFGLAATAVKAVGSFAIDLITGAIRIAGGILSLNGKLLLEGLDDIVSGFVGAVAIIFLKFVELLQTIVPVEQPGRPLTPAERDMLRRIYRHSLSLGAIRVNDRTSGFFSVNPSPFTLGNTIFLKGENVDPADPAGNPLVLVHESVHVWQYQHEGSSYIGRALGNAAFEPATNTNGGWLVDIAAGRLRWTDFGKEAQAWFVEDVFTVGQLTSGSATASGHGVFFDADGEGNIGSFVWSSVDHTALANDAVVAIRRRVNFRLSQFL